MIKLVHNETNNNNKNLLWGLIVLKVVVKLFVFFLCLFHSFSCLSRILFCCLVCFLVCLSLCNTHKHTHTQSHTHAHSNTHLHTQTYTLYHPPHTLPFFVFHTHSHLSDIVHSTPLYLPFQPCTSATSLCLSVCLSLTHHTPCTIHMLFTSRIRI